MLFYTIHWFIAFSARCRPTAHYWKMPLSNALIRTIHVTRFGKNYLRYEECSGGFSFKISQMFRTHIGNDHAE